MAFEVGKEESTPLRSTDSYLRIIEQAGWDRADGYDADTGHPVWPAYDPRESYIDTESGTARRPYPFQPQSSSLGITRNRTLLDADYFDATPIRNKAAQGPMSIGGDISMYISGNGTGMMLRSILQDTAPVATWVEDPTTTNVLAAKDATGSTADTTFVDDLTGCYVPVRLSITLSDSPAVDSGETSAVFTISGKNRWGETETADLEWTQAEITADVLTKTTVMYFAEIDSSQPDGHLSNGDYAINYERPAHTTVVASTASLTATGNITIADNLSGEATVMPLYINPDSAAMADTTMFGYIRIEGTDHRGRAINNVVRYQNNATDLARTKKTSRYFRTVTQVTVEGFTAGTFAAVAVNTAQDVTITPSTKLVSYLTMEVGKGSKPNSYRNVIPASTSFNFARTEPVRATITCLGGYAQLGYNLRDGRTPSSGAKLNIKTKDKYSGWQADVRIGNKSVDARSATITVAHNLEEYDGLGGAYPSAPPNGIGKRDFMLTIEARATDENDFTEIYECNETLLDVSVVLTNEACGDFPYQLIFEFPEMEITEDPDFVVEDFGIVGTTLSLRAIGAEGFTYEGRIRAKYSEWYPVSTFS